MTPAEAGGVHRLRDWRLKGGARSKNVMRMWSRAVLLRLAAESGNKYMLSLNHLSSVVGRPTSRMRVLDNVPEWTRILGGCSLPYSLLCLCILFLVVIHPVSALRTSKWCIF